MLDRTALVTMEGASLVVQVQDAIRAERSPPPSGGPWDAFFARYDPRIRRMVRAWHLPEADADDCVQEIWAELLEKLGAFRYDPRRGRLEAWLATLVRRKVSRLVRRRARGVVLLADPSFSPGSADADPAVAAERRESRRLVRRALAVLRRTVSAENYRIVRLRWMAGRNTREVAESMRMSEEQVRYRLHRMKGKLRRLMTADGVNARGDDGARILIIPKKARHVRPACGQ